MNWNKYIYYLIFHKSHYYNLFEYVIKLILPLQFIHMCIMINIPTIIYFHLHYN